MKYVLIIHEVAEYETWKALFDTAAALRKEAGEISYQVLKFAGEPNKIVHFSVWNTLANAKLFFESPLLKQIRQEAGVISPAFLYLEELEKGIL